MEIEECYQKLGGNYEEVKLRIPKLTLIEKYLNKFLEDKNFEKLTLAIELKNRDDAFIAVHTLKGICANLGFSYLFDSVSKFTDCIRPLDKKIDDEALNYYNRIRTDYTNTIAVINAYLDK